jgi:hypothetical protein
VRRAFNLAEIAFVAGLGALVLGLLFQTYSGAVRSAARLEMRLAGLAGTQLFLDRLRHDVACAVHAPADERPLVEKDTRLNLLLYAGHKALENPAMLYDPAQNDPSWLLLDRVRYDFDPASGYLTRTAPGGAERLTFAKYRTLVFSEGQGTLKIAVTIGDAAGAPLVIELPLPYRTEYRVTEAWPDEYFHTQPRVRERK